MTITRNQANIHQQNDLYITSQSKKEEIKSVISNTYSSGELSKGTSEILEKMYACGT
jgi:hypothetical protein